MLTGPLPLTHSWLLKAPTYALARSTRILVSPLLFRIRTLSVKLLTVSDCRFAAPLTVRYALTA